MSSVLADRRGTPAVVDGPLAWRVVGFAALMLAMSAPGQTVGVSVFVDPMIADLGISRSAISTAYLAGTLTGAALLPRAGRLVDVHGVRRMTAAIGLAFGAALGALAGVSNVVALGAAFVAIRFLGQGALGLTSSTSVAVWFHRRRGTALGVRSAVGAALMSLAPLIAAWAVLLPIAVWGLPARAAAGPAARPAAAGGNAGTAQWTRPEALPTSMFWTVTAAVATSGMITTALSFHPVSLLGERGLSPAQAAANFLPQTAATITATLAMGVIVDRVAPRLLVVTSMGLLIAALALAQVAAPGARARIRCRLSMGHAAQIEQAFTSVDETIGPRIGVASRPSCYVQFRPAPD